MRVEGDGKHVRDDGPYGLFQRNDARIRKAYEETSHAEEQMVL